ncbi:cobalt-zinc-cadmium resistance protein [Imbroritus primus]|uniref:Cobalt-zinc-cadmium resistance protein n=1 Tax=Imbroritus primus TaxID=3058603 RepID=A0ACD3STX6_9BURK|nr:cobalt-zinc-cadmium resistance protein [Burkholderiaceae bacterium PBA]
MRRLLAIFLLLLLPLQTVWAAAAPYCQHEKVPSTFHLGHHTHLHQVDLPGEDTDSNAPAGTADIDCHACHAFCGAMPVTTLLLQGVDAPVILPVSTSLAPPTPPQLQPERPNWPVRA